MSNSRLHEDEAPEDSIERRNQIICAYNGPPWFFLSTRMQDYLQEYVSQECKIQLSEE